MIAAAALAGLGLIALPHAIGAPVTAPEAEDAGRAALSQIWISLYAAAVLVVTGIFWLLLGLLVAAFFRHLDRKDTSRRPRGG